RGDRLGVAIRSICEQIREIGAPARILVCDNASTDSTPQVVADLRREFPGLISYHRHAFNYGGAVNFKTIFGLAEYEWLWLMGDDDFLAPGGLKTMLPLLQDAKEDFFHVAEVPRCSNTGIHRGTLFELCNDIGWLEMTGFMSSLVMRDTIAMQICALKNWAAYGRTSYLYGCALLEVAAHRRAALVDLPIVDLQDRVQTPETLKRWAATDHDQGYRRVCEALGLLRDAGAIPGRVNRVFFRYVTYHLWDRFISQHLSRFGRTGQAVEEIEWQRIGKMIELLEPEDAEPVRAAADLARSAMDGVDPEKDRDALVKRLNALIESHSQAVYPYTYLAKEAGELMAA
ncbi:MAG: glycosyltransferase, partial [Sulfuricaulis sp.]|nr:glycosyltransferase [Sulfuricaulis sp.]